MTLGLVNVVLAPSNSEAAAQAPPAPTAPAARTTVPPPAATAAPAAHPLDEPLRLLAKAKQAMATVQDYSCTLIKQERIGDVMTPVSVATMMVRHEPFSVYLKFHQPKSSMGQEACYVAGKNGGKMRAKSHGILGAVGFVSVEPTDPRAMKMSNHPITEAGMVNMIKRFEKRWTGERAFNRADVKIGEYEYSKRRCTRVETAYTENVPGAPYYRSVVYFDKENHAPIRVELYDWPRAGGQQGGELMAMYSYVNLKLNAGLPDSVFNK
jgi:hypothetical protein